MTEYRNLFLLILGILPLMASACVTLEEGGDGYLTCGSSNVQQHITFQLLLNGQFVNVSTCRVDGTCQDFRPDLVDSELLVSGDRKSNRLHIRRVDKNQDIFRCLIDTRIAGVCDIDVFVSPARPTCSAPVVNQATSQVSVTCRTDTVFPSATCVFFHRGDDVPQAVSGAVTYSVTDSIVSPGNKAVECTIDIDLSVLTRRSYQFAVQMRANVNDISKARYTRSAYLCPFYPDPADEPANSQCQNTVDPDTPTTFGTQLCGAIEIGETGYLNCGTTRGNVDNNIRFELYQNNAFQILTSCTPAGVCQNNMPSNYQVDFRQLSGDRIQHHLQIISLDRDQTIFKCAIDNRIGGICEIDAYVRPAKPTCDAPVMTAGNSEVLITCRTTQVFPRATCKFYYFTIALVPVSGEISYVESQSPVNADDRQTECSIRIPAQSLPTNSIRFLVRMHPDVSGSSIPAVFSDILAPFQVTV